MNEPIKLFKHFIVLNPLVLNDRKKLSALLMDILSEGKVSAKQLLLAFDSGVIKNLLSENMVDQFAEERFINELVSTYSMDTKAATEVIKFWVQCIDGTLKNAFDKQLRAPKDDKKETNKSITSKCPDFDEGQETKDKGNKSKNNNTDCKNLFNFPSGVGQNDFGFSIEGIQPTERCEHEMAALFAVVFSFFQKQINAVANKNINDFFLREGVQLDYGRIFRLQFVILLMIKHNYIGNDNKINVNYSGNYKELEAALNNLNHYGKILSTLIGKEYRELKVESKKNALKISIDGTDTDIKVKNVSHRVHNFHPCWYENNLIYSIDSENLEHKKNLEILLNDLLNMNQFRPGQLEAISNVLNDNRHKICVMPTGAGKSLVFYFIALLRSCPTYVIVPTELLIEDQIRNLWEFHKIDDVIKIDQNQKINLKNNTQKLQYLTPSTFLHRELINDLICMDYSQTIANVVLDEVHCLSNWSHDFRPDYLMLSFVLGRFVEKTGYLCFTATANYSVLKDLMHQFKIGYEQILMEKNAIIRDIEFSFTEAKDETDMTHQASFLHDKLIQKNRRIISYTKNKIIANHYRNALSQLSRERTDIYDGKRLSYIEFASMKTNALVAYSEVGIGINLPNITDTIHFGIPVSKGQFAQEIGRAGREGVQSHSSVFFVNTKILAPNANLIRRNIPVKDLLQELRHNTTPNDLTDAYKQIFNHLMSADEFLNSIIETYNNVKTLTEPAKVKFELKKGASYKAIMRAMYVLYRTGLIAQWYIEDFTNKSEPVFFVVPQNTRVTLSQIKESTINYLRAMGDYNSAINSIKSAEDEQQVLGYYVEWYYEQFMYHHREQLLEMCEFLHHFKNSDSKTISNALRNYFSISLLAIAKTAVTINDMTYKDILLMQQDEADMMEEGIRRSSEHQFSPKTEFFIFCMNIKKYNDFDEGRIIAVMDNIHEYERHEIIENLAQIYQSLEVDSQVSIINQYCRFYSLEKVVDLLYSQVPKDEAYAIILVLCVNRKWGEQGVCRH